MKILVLGYYNKENLGDELFKDAFLDILSGHNLMFMNLDSLVSYDHDTGAEPRLNLNIGRVDIVICGCGDIFNDYFIPKIRFIKSVLNVPFYAIGVGIEYPSVIDRGDLDIFEYILLREVTDLRHLQQRLGSTSVGALPDPTFRLSIQVERQKPGFSLGLCLVRNTPSDIVDSMHKMIDELRPLGSLVGIPFNTEIIGGKYSDENDIPLFDKLGVKIIDRIPKTYNQMIYAMSELRVSVCQRYHSILLAIRAGVPFVALVTTRKAELFMKETGYSWWTKDPLKITKLVKAVIQNLNRAKTIISNLETRLSARWMTGKIKNILTRKHTRTRFPTSMTLHDAETDVLINNVFVSLESGEDPELVAEEMCWGVTKMVGSSYVYGSVGNLRALSDLNPEEKINKIREMIHWIIQDHARNVLTYANRLDLTYMNQDIFRGYHRAGWQFVSDAMMSLSANGGVICDTYIDRTFHWGSKALKKLGILPYLSPWIGFVHHGAKDGTSDYSEFNTRALISSDLFQQSLPTCRGIITLSESLAEWIRKRVPGVNVMSLMHPTVTVKSITRLHPSRCLFHVGAWYRNLVSFYKIDSPLKKIALKGRNMGSTFPPDDGAITHKLLTGAEIPGNKFMLFLIKELRSHQNWVLREDEEIPLFKPTPVGTPKRIQKLKRELDHMINSVEIMTEVDNNAYDKIMEENVVFLDLIDASAVNVVIECMVRNTPLVINPLPAVVEYLGSDYPLYYNNLSEVSSLLSEDRLQSAIDYLNRADKRPLQIDSFMDTLRSSRLYQNLNKEMTSLITPTNK